MLFLSSESRKRNSPELQFNGACGTENYFVVNTNGNEMSLIADLGSVPLEDITAAKGGLSIFVHYTHIGIAMSRIAVESPVQAETRKDSSEPEIPRPRPGTACTRHTHRRNRQRTARYYRRHGITFGEVLRHKRRLLDESPEGLRINSDAAEVVEDHREASPAAYDCSLTGRDAAGMELLLRIPPEYARAMETQDVERRLPTFEQSRLSHDDDAHQK